MTPKSAPFDMTDVVCPADLKEATSWMLRAPGMPGGTVKEDCTKIGRLTGCTVRSQMIVLK